jgi:hypothetical protein
MIFSFEKVAFLRVFPFLDLAVVSGESYYNKQKGKEKLIRKQ